MARKHYSAGQIIGKLLEAVILLAKHQTVGQITREADSFRDWSSSHVK